MNKIAHFVHTIGKGSHLMYIRGERKYLSAPERLRFYRAASNIVALRKRAVCLIPFFTGCRISEALNLRVCDIDFSDRVIIFRTLKQRSHERYRVLPAPPELLDLLHSIIVNEGLGAEQRIINRCRTWGYKRIKECMTAAKLDGIKATPTGLRHAFAVSCMENAINVLDIQKLLGHAKLGNTQIYLDIVGKEMHTMVSRTWPKVRKQKK